MFRDLDLESGDVVLEYGPGTGAFTMELERLRAQGVALSYLGLENDPGMHRFLVRRFPDLDFVLGDAVDAVALWRASRLPPARAVISGLPLCFMDRRTVEPVFEATDACLRPDGVFRTFSYLHSYPLRSAGELRELMSHWFEDYRVSAPVLRNLPPALMLTGRGPKSPGGPPPDALPPLGPRALGR